jgi:hypothetical protein
MQPPTSGAWLHAIDVEESISEAEASELRYRSLNRRRWSQHPGVVGRLARSTSPSSF